MIKKERLEELIKEQKGCYIMANKYTIGYVHLKEKYEPIIEDREDNYNLWVFTDDILDFRDCIHSYSLFETKEEAEWELKFGNITRTETLRLPSWEEAQDKDFHFCYLYQVEHFCFYIDIYNFTNEFRIRCSHGIHLDDYVFDKTFDLRDKENYIEACKLCKKLFLGEEV